MSDNFIKVSRELGHRAWSDIEPKIAVGFASGTFAAIAVQILAAYHIALPASIAPYVPYVVSMIGGYLAPSASTTVVKDIRATVINGNATSFASPGPTTPTTLR